MKQVKKISKSMFESTPSLLSSQKLSQLYREYVKQTLTKNIEVVQNATKSNLQHVIEQVSNFEDREKWSTDIYYSNFRLTQAMMKKDITEIVDVIHTIQSLSTGQSYVPYIDVKSILSEKWEHSYIHSLRQDPTRNDGKKSTILPLVFSSAEKYRSDIEQAISLIHDLDTGMGSEVQSYLNSIHLFTGNGLVGATSPQAFGTIYLRVPGENDDPVLYFLEHIVHEVSHLHMHQLMAFDQVIENCNTDLYPAPIRNDMRPMIGIFHATFVLSRMVRIFEKLSLLQPGNRNSNNLAKKIIHQFNKGFEVVTKSSQPTRLGSNIVETLLSCSRGQQ